MKKINIQLSAMCVLVAALASCSKASQEYIYQAEPGEIVFSAGDGLSVDVQTKSVTESTVSVLQSAGFNAAVVIDDGNAVMFNKAVAHEGGIWKVSGETYYYPVTGTVSAYGVYPKTRSVTVTSGAASVSYTQPAGSSEDLIVAKALAVAKSDSPVALQFSHALAQVAVKCKGLDTNADYVLKSVTVTAPAGATYSYSTDTWGSLGEATEYVCYSNAGAAVSTSAFQAFGETQTYVPGTVSVRAVWDCRNKVDHTVIGEYDQTVDNITLPMGKISTLNLSLPNSDAREIIFSVSVNAWSNESQEITMEEPSLVLPGVFTVSTSPLKTVKFAKGNLYWNGSKFDMEEHQYDYPVTRNADHIGHFYYSKDAAVARAASYSDGSKTDSDVLFAANGGAIEGYTVLTNDEWKYLMDHNMKSKDAVTIAGKKCSVLVPDGYAGSVASSYTAETWAAAEAEGLVAIPHAGYYSGGSFNDAGSYGYVWSASPDASNADFACSAIFYSGDASADYGLRGDGYSVRLVQVQ